MHHLKKPRFSRWASSVIVKWWHFSSCLDRYQVVPVERCHLQLPARFVHVSILLPVIDDSRICNQTAVDRVQYNRHWAEKYSRDEKITIFPPRTLWWTRVAQASWIPQQPLPSLYLCPLMFSSLSPIAGVKILCTLSKASYFSYHSCWFTYWGWTWPFHRASTR